MRALSFASEMSSRRRLRFAFVAAARKFVVVATDEAPGKVPVLEIEEVIDLHGFQPRDIPDVVADYLEAALERGFLEVRLIHGRGKGVQRARVQALLARHPQVDHFADAPAKRGGWGATLVYLKPPRNSA